ncbi:MAG: FG-GAP repeat protein, partial [Pirellulaceae bacterium]|nr:FG-GAP repeat protein [Pirellulaceae bacterium]
TILKGVNTGLDAITFVGGSVTKHGSASSWSRSRNEYIANNKPMEWGTISAATRLDLIVTGDINFTLADLEPALGQTGFLQQVREKLAALKLTGQISVDFTNDGKFRFRTPDSIVIKSIKEQVRFAASSSVMTGTQVTIEPVVAPRITNWGYAPTTYAGENLELMLDTSQLKQITFTLDKISDDFLLVLKPELSRASSTTAANSKQEYNGFVRDVAFINNNVRLLVNSKATPQEIVQQLNQQFQKVPILLNTAGTLHYPYFRIAMNIRVDLEAKLENGKITIRVKDAFLGSITYLYFGGQVSGSRIFIQLGGGSGGLFSIANASRNFTSLLGFGNSGTEFKEIKRTAAGPEEYGAAPAIMALSESLPKPWSYGVTNATNSASINLGMLNNDALPDFATLDGNLIRLYYGTADLQSTFKSEVFSIGTTSIFADVQNSQIQAGDFNGDGKTDLAITYEQRVAQVAQGAIEKRVAIFYAMADKIAANVAAGRTNLPVTQADVNIMAGLLDDSFGLLSNRSGIDVNRDGVDDLVIAAPRASKLYLAAGTATSNFAPSNIVELSTMGIAGRGSFLTDTGAGKFIFDNSGTPYTLTSGVDRWFRFTTLGDGLSNDVVRLLVPNLPLGSIPKLTVELFDGAGRSLRAGQSAVSLRGLEAGTYYVHVINKDTQSLNFSLEISPPKDTQVIEALNVRNADKLNPGENNSRAIPAKPGPQLDVDPVTTLFSNALLRDAIYKAINKRPGSTVRLSDLASIAYLSVPGTTGAQLTDLNGIERLTNLIVLDLPGHNLSDNALAPLQKLTRLQALNLRGSNVQLSDLFNVPTSLKQMILGSIKDGSDPAQASKAALELRRLTLLENLQIGTSTTNLIVPETVTQDGPASIINATNTTFQLVSNVAPTVTMPNVITTINEGQLLTFASLMATPGLSITDRDPIVATTVAIVGPAGDQTTLQSQSASPSMLFNKGTTARFNVPITERMRSNTFTIESWVRVGADADLTPIANAPLAIISGGWTGSSGYSLDIVHSNGQYYWSARVKDKSLRLFKLETTVVRDTWVHLALTLDSQGQNSLASLTINGVKATEVSVSGYTPPAIGSNLTVGLGGVAFDEVRVFNKARTVAEIVASKDVAIAANAPNLVGYWNFDDAVARSNKQINTPQHATPTDLVLLDGYRTIPAGQFTRFENLTQFAWEGADTISFRFDAFRVANGLTYNANVLPYFGVRTISGDYVVPNLGTAFQTEVPNNFSRRWLNYRLKDLVLMTDRTKTLPANEKVVS